MIKLQLLLITIGYLPSDSISSTACFGPHTQPTNRQKASAPRGIIRLSVNFSITAFIGSMVSPCEKSNQGSLMPLASDCDREYPALKTVIGTDKTMVDFRRLK